MRWFFGIPPVLYRALYGLGRGEWMRGRMLLLTTHGRRSHRPRTCALNYAQVDGTVYVMAGFRKSDWIANLRADPRVEVSLGQDRWTGEARIVSDPDERRRAAVAARAQAVTQGPPQAIKPLLRRLGFDYDEELKKLDDPGLELVTVAIGRIEMPDDSGSRYAAAGRPPN